MGRRVAAKVTSPQGKYVRHRYPLGQCHDIAIDATLRAAAFRQRSRQPGDPLQIQPEDLREKVRKHKCPLVLAVVLDNSHSMKVHQVIETVKGLVLSLLVDVRHHRDKIGVVVFKRGGRPDASVLLPVTSSYRRAEIMLSDVPVSSRTPLAGGLLEGFRLLQRERWKHKDYLPLLLVVTDGLANVPLLNSGYAYDDVYRVCHLIRQADIPTIVVDVEPSVLDRDKSCVGEIVRLTEAYRISLEELAPEISA